MSVYNGASEFSIIYDANVTGHASVFYADPARSVSRISVVRYSINTVLSKYMYVDIYLV